MGFTKARSVFPFMFGCQLLYEANFLLENVVGTIGRGTLGGIVEPQHENEQIRSNESN